MKVSGRGGLLQVFPGIFVHTRLLILFPAWLISQHCFCFVWLLMFSVSLMCDASFSVFCLCKLWECQWASECVCECACVRASVPEPASESPTHTQTHPHTSQSSPHTFPRESSSVCFFTTQLSESPLRPPEPAVPQRPSPCPSGSGGTRPHQSTQQQPQWRQVALPPGHWVETAVKKKKKSHSGIFNKRLLKITGANAPRFSSF